MRVLPGRPVAANPNNTSATTFPANPSSTSSQSPNPSGTSASPAASSSLPRSSRGSNGSRSAGSSSSQSTSSRRRAPQSLADAVPSSSLTSSSSSLSSRPFSRTLSQDSSSRSRRALVESSPPVFEEAYNSDDEDPASSSSCSSRPSAPPTSQQSEEQRDREVRFEKLVRKRRGLALRRVKGDGACMFRAVADQLYGDEEMHRVVRQDAVTYMHTERDHFSQFVTEDFDDYLRRKSGATTYGNNLELQAISELYNRPIEVYYYSTDPIVIKSRDADFIASHAPLRLSYHRNQHYNSLRETATAASLAANGGSSLAPSVPYEQLLLRDVLRQSAQRDFEDNAVQEARYLSDLERTEREMEELAIARSLAESVGMRASSASPSSLSSPGASVSSSRSSSPSAF